MFFFLFFLQSLSFEPGFITLLVVGVMLALLVPFGLATYGCVETSRKCKSASQSETPINVSSESLKDSCGNCRRRGVLCCLQLIVVLIA